MRFVLVLAVAACVAGAALADIGPPDPPSGKRRVDVKTEVRRGTGVSGYVFVVSTSERFHRQTIGGDEWLELGDSKAHHISNGGWRTYASLYAIPEAEAKAYSGISTLMQAVRAEKVSGARCLNFSTTAEVGRPVLGDSVTWTYTITGIDEQGILTTVSGRGADEVNTPDGHRARDRASMPGGWCGGMMGGLMGAAAITFGGLWLLRRKK